MVLWKTINFFLCATIVYVRTATFYYFFYLIRFFFHCFWNSLACKQSTWVSFLAVEQTLQRDNNPSKPQSVWTVR